jgi:hypothetical protein
MLSLYDILLIKEQNNNEKLIYVQFGKHDYIFRLLAPKEYVQCKLLTGDEYERNDAICQLCLVYPEGLSFAENPIGCLSDKIADEIVEKSMIFRDLDVLVKFEDNQEALKRFLPECMNFVKAAFNEFSYDDIESWSYEKLMNMTAKAERVLQLRAGDIGGEVIKLGYEIDEEKINNPPPEPTAEELIKQGIDPMLYFSKDIVLKKPLVDDPVILGSDWRNEELMKRVGKQIHKRPNN